MHSGISERLTQLIETEAIAEIYEIFSVSVSPGTRQVICVDIDRKEGGISVEECKRLNETIGALVESSRLVQGPYSLEVASPGMDWPLKSEKDFRRITGKLINIVYAERDSSNVRELKAVVVQVDNGILRVRESEERDREIDIPLTMIEKAKAEINIRR